MTPEQLADMELIEQARRFHRIGFYKPYPKQKEFHDLGATQKERGLIAGNQVGKTMAGGAEDAIHLTGLYPSWWKGHRFDHPIQMWVAGPKMDKVRDTTQEMLFGSWKKPNDFGTGFLPKEAIIGTPSLKHGTQGAYDTFAVKWKDKNGKLDDSAISTGQFKGYTEGQLSFASNTIDAYHGDEESDLEIYIEARTRLQVKRGISYLTLTPLLGWTPLVTRLLRELAGATIKMGLYDVEHYTREQADRIIAGFPPHLRDAKAFGDPALGEGKIFLTSEDLFVVPRIEVLPHWAKLWGLDFGGSGAGSHPFAAVLAAWDRDYDILYIVHSLRLKGMSRLQHIPKMREIGADVPVAWPHDGHEKREGASGVQELALQYKNPMPGMPGLRMLADHATWPDGGFSTEAAVAEMDARMATGRVKIFDDQRDLLDEIRQYHRDEGLIVKEGDDLISALFKILMMKRYARPGLLTYQMQKVGKYNRKPDEWWNTRPTQSPICDPWTGQPLA